MANVALVTTELPDPGGAMGGVGTFTLHWAQLLQQAGEDVTVVLARLWRGTVFNASWRRWLERRGLTVLELVDRDYPVDRQPYYSALDMSERLADQLTPFAAVYFPDYAGLATLMIRRGRLPAAAGPPCVTVVHGGSAWVRIGDHQYEVHSMHPEHDYLERYAIEGSDWLASPSHFMVNWLEARGQKPPRDRTRALGLPLLPAAAPTAAGPSGDIDHVIYFGRE